jgi:hypothetical protein
MPWLGASLRCVGASVRQAVMRALHITALARVTLLPGQHRTPPRLSNVNLSSTGQRKGGSCA